MQLVPRKKQCTEDENVVDEPMTLESPSLESESLETEDTPGSMIYVDTAELRSVSQHESKPDVHSTTFAMDEENVLKSENIYHRSMLTSLNREWIELPPVPEEHLAEGVSFLDMVHQMVNIIYLLNKHLNDLPGTVH